MNRFRFFKGLSLVVVIIAALAVGCGPKNEKAELKSVSELEQAIMTSENQKETDSLSKLLITALRNELKEEKDDRKIMENMFKIANLYYVLKDYNQAIDMCESIAKAYPRGEITPQAIFFEAVVYQFDLQQYGKANMLYDKILTQFPTSPQAEEAKHMVENMGLTESELIKKFEENN